MIGKIFAKSSGSFKDRIRYIFGCSKHDHAISRIITIDSNCLTPDPLPGVQAGSEEVLTEMIQEFDQVEHLRKLSIDSDKAIKPVFHAMLSLLPGESLTPAQWQTAVRKYLKDLGFKDTHKYVAVMHQDTDHQHVHIVANRIEMDEGFRVLKDSNERSISIDSVSDIEDTFSLYKAPKPTETWGVNISHSELQASIKDGEIPFKHIIIAKIAGAIEKTREKDGDMIDFVRLLRKQRVYIHLTLNDEGQPKGIAYEYKDKVISGRKLKRARLTFQKLTKQEGINYDPETISDLQREIAIRNDEDKISAKRTSGHWYYFRFESKEGHIRHYKFKSKEQKMKELVEAILALLEMLFGIPFSALESDNRKVCQRWEPGQPLPESKGLHP